MHAKGRRTTGTKERERKRIEERWGEGERSVILLSVAAYSRSRAASRVGVRRSLVSASEREESALTASLSPRQSRDSTYIQYIRTREVDACIYVVL